MSEYVNNKSGVSVYNTDCVELVKKMPDNSVDFSIYSPPFSNLYTYSDNVRDMGNTNDDNHFFEQYKYFIKEHFRVTRNGRLTAIHCKDLPMYKGRDGAGGLRDFPGDIIRAHEECGWTFHSRVTIWKDPVIEMQRTKNQGLLYKQVCADSAYSRQGMADYMIIMRKNVYEDHKPVTRGGERFCDYKGSSICAPTDSDIHRARNEEEKKRLYSIAVWQRYASPVWFDINQTNCLNIKQARSEKDEKHICPLQLDVIERSIELWSNPDDVVFTPFLGIGSEVVTALKMGRKGIGSELKPEYFNVAVKNIKETIKEKSGLFDE